MAIEFTREQFENLLKLVYLGNWMVNGIRTEDERIGQFQEIEQYLYSFAGEFDLEGLVEFDQQKKSFQPTQELETGSDVETYKVQYDSEIFWGELTQRMASRDFLRVYGDQLASIGLHEQAVKRTECIKKYVDEFEEHGINNLGVNADIKI
jgi:hypothetical protein